MTEPDDEVESTDGSDEPLLDGAYETRFGELTVADDEPEPDPHRRRRNNRMLLGLIGAGLAVVVALAVVGLVVVGHFLDRSSSLSARMSVTYQKQFRHCLDAGGGRGECATQAEADCAGDPDWTTVKDPADRARQIADACRFGPDATG
jgi:hypothetical protein